MAIKDRKITDAQILQHGVCAAPDKLEQSAAENKSVFDRLVKNVVQGAHNGLIEELCGVGGAANVGTADGGTVQGHLNSRQNPHGVTKAQVGLALADNTADLDKPISNAQAAVNAQKADKADTFTKAQTLAQIDQKVVEVGTGDMAQAVYDPHHRKQDIFSTFSNPNQLVNGDFQIWQRGTSFPNITSTIYTADRWVCASASGSGLSICKADNGLKMVKSFAGTWVLMTQRFEHLPKQFPLTVSASIDNRVVSLTMDTASPVKTAPFAGGYLEAGIGGAGGSGFSVTVVLTEQKEITVNWVKAEYGTAATPFVPRFYGEELSMCQRYYENLGSFRIYKGARNPWSMASELPLYPFKAIKRTIPTVKFKYMRSDGGGTAVPAASHPGFNGFSDYNCVFDCDYVDFTEVFADAEIY